MPPSKFEGSLTLRLEVRCASFSISISVFVLERLLPCVRNTVLTSWFSQTRSHLCTSLIKDMLAHSLSTLFGILRSYCSYENVLAPSFIVISAKQHLQ